MDEFTGKVAVVTGAASGIGRALARRCAGEGMRVVLADIEAEPLEQAAGEIGDEIGADHVLAVPTDVRNADAVEALAAATFDRFGAAHVVCNNAGVGVGGLAWTIPADRWRWIVEVNLLSVAHGIRAFVPRMIEQGEGHVVNTASAAGLLTGPGMSPYYATKHGVVALSESLHFDLGIVGSPVGVSVLCPEWVRTRIAESERNRPADVGEMPGMAALGDGAGPGALIQGLVDRGIDPDDVAAMVLDGIRERRFWIVTHPTTVPRARQRWEAIATGGQPVLWDVTAG